MNLKEYPTESTFLEGPPGMTNKGVGFNIRTGEVFINEKMVKKFDLFKEIREFVDPNGTMNMSQNMDLTGNFYGIGIDISRDRLFFSFNGRIINTLDFKVLGEIRYVAHEMIVQELIDKDDNLDGKAALNDYTGLLKLSSKTKTKIRKNKKYKGNWSEFLLPVIYLDSMCVVNWNIGGLPFKIKDPMGSGIIGLIDEEMKEEEIGEIKEEEIEEIKEEEKI